jgi:lysine 2,3-aminomutase
MKNRIRSFEQLKKYLPSLKRNLEIPQVTQKYPLAITPYYASLIQIPTPDDPVFAMCVPQIAELVDPSFLTEDPLDEHADMPIPGLIHRYSDRALVILTTTCASYCRHCTRKRIAGKREVSISPRRLDQVVQYLTDHPEISDVILSGGDPLTMTTDALESVISRIRLVRSVQVIRIGTRVPVVLPMRITDELVCMLKKYHPLWINTHFNHPQELTAAAARACEKLADAGIPLGNQTVLLRGINDSPEIIEQLCRQLIRFRVRPYYMYQCDPVRGVEHFRTPLAKGIEIMEYLRGRLSGIAIPTFVVDMPSGGGKVPLSPNYIVSVSPTHTVLRNYEGLFVSYPEPGIDTHCDETSQTVPIPGIWDLACGKASGIRPAETIRHKRRSSNSARMKVCPGQGLLFE